MERFEPIKGESWQSAKNTQKRITLKQVEEMNYSTPPQKPDLDDLIFNICIVCAIIVIMVIVGFIIF